VGAIVRAWTQGPAQAFSWSLRPLGDTPYLGERGSEGGYPIPAGPSQDVPTHSVEISSTAASRNRSPAIWASKGLGGQLAPSPDLLAPGEDAPARALMAAQQRQQKKRVCPRNSGSPSIPHTAHLGRRHPKKLAAALEWVRQWESLLLQNIEESSQPCLTVEIEEKPVTQELQSNTHHQPET
jgi:hypothetical protein